MNRVSIVKNKLEKRELCFGTHCSVADLDFYEMCGLLGYDYVWIDNEHAGMTQPMIKNAIIAANAGGSCAFVRVPDHEAAHIKPVLECGPDGIVFPMVNTAEEAEKCVAICTYPPGGIRGFGPLRSMDYGTKDLQSYISSVDDSFLRLIQCEHIESVENLDEILEVPGVNGVICGPMDLSASIGKIGEFHDPEMRRLMQAIIDKCKAHGKPFGLSVGGMQKEFIAFWLEQGACFLSVGDPQDYFRDMSYKMREEIRVLKRKNS